jgi:hypothetical protein
MSDPNEATGYLRAKSRDQKVGSGDTLMTVSKTDGEDVTIRIVMPPDPLLAGAEIDAVVVDGPKAGADVQVKAEYEDLEVPGFWTRLGSKVAVIQPGGMPGKLASGTRVRLRLL